MQLDQAARQNRWLIDVSVIKAFESGVLDLSDFYLTGDDYRYHIDVEAKRRFMNMLKEQFNTGVRCKGGILKWDTVIEQKTMELARLLIGKSRLPSFSGPKPELTRTDNSDHRKGIPSPSRSQAQRLRTVKSVFHGMCEHVPSNTRLRGILEDD